NRSFHPQFSGYAGNLFSSGPYEKDDEEADAVYESVDRKMDERRKQYRERREREELEKFREERPKIQQMFSDLKRKLGTISEDEWSSIPAVGDARNKKQRTPQLEKITPVPDSLFARGLAQGATVNSLDSRQQQYGGINTPFPSGLNTPFPGTSTPGWTTPAGELDMRKIGQARNTLMGMRLSQVSDSVSGQTVVDPKGYLTDLHSMLPQYGGDVADIKKARLLLKSVRETNPKHPPAWIASARLEEVTGKLQIARNIIMKGTEIEDVWLEAARLQPNDISKAVCASAIVQLPLSVKIWIRAASLETDDKAKKRVYRKERAELCAAVDVWLNHCKSLTKLDLLMDRTLLNLNFKLLFTNICSHTTHQHHHAPSPTQCTTNTTHHHSSPHHASTPRTTNTTFYQHTHCSNTTHHHTMHHQHHLPHHAALENVPNSVRLWKVAVELEEADDARIMLSRSVECCPHSTELWLALAKLETYQNARKVCSGGGGGISFYTFGIFVILMTTDHYLIISVNSHIRVHVYPFQALLLKKLPGLSKCPRAIPLWRLLSSLEQKKGTLTKARAVLEKARLKNPNCPELWLASIRLEWNADIKNIAKSLMARALQECPSSGLLWAEAVFIEGRAQRKTKSVDALKKCEHDPHVLLAIARLFWSERKLTKAREWFLRTVKIDQDFGDAWAFFYRFELAHGNEDKQQEVLKRCINAEPRHGQLWQTVSKDIKNWKLKTKELLPIISSKVPVAF
uniref:Pre-mRNA-processing factor 6 n=1 Tax=Ciona savignyi TaxID=51511 RepID=H2ZEY5_CIOSA